MAKKVLKFGGTSVGTIERNLHVHQNVISKFFLYFFTKGAIHPGVMECSPPKVIGKSFLSILIF